MGVKHAITTTVKEIIQTALISLGIFFFVYIFLVQPHRVKGDSMVPNFKDSELLLTEKVSYRLSAPQKGDVIVFQAPGRRVDFIKRIVGLPGETIQIESGAIYINGKKLNEEYLKVGTEGDVNKTLGRDEYFVMGDNRGSSFDSRAIGPIKKDTIRGRAWIVYWPLVKNEKSAGARVISRIHYSISNLLYNR